MTITTVKVNSTNLQEHLEQLKIFLSTAPTHWEPHETIRRFALPQGDYISCVLWNNLFHISGTDIVKSLMFRFLVYGRPVHNHKKFEEGVFSDLRNLKPGIDASLEEPRSDFLEMLYRNNCIRTQKKQKVFYWYSVPHDRLFIDALERDLKREALGIQPTTFPNGALSSVTKHEFGQEGAVTGRPTSDDGIAGIGTPHPAMDANISSVQAESRSPALGIQRKHSAPQPQSHSDVLGSLLPPSPRPSPGHGRPLERNPGASSQVLHTDAGYARPSEAGECGDGAKSALASPNLHEAGYVREGSAAMDNPSNFASMAGQDTVLAGFGTAAAMKEAAAAAAANTAPMSRPSSEAPSTYQSPYIASSTSSAVDGIPVVGPPEFHGSPMLSVRKTEGRYTETTSPSLGRPRLCDSDVKESASAANSPTLSAVPIMSLPYTHDVNVRPSPAVAEELDESLRKLQSRLPRKADPYTAAAGAPRSTTKRRRLDPPRIVSNERAFHRPTAGPVVGAEEDPRLEGGSSTSPERTMHVTNGVHVDDHDQRERIEPFAAFPETASEEDDGVTGEGKNQSVNDDEYHNEDHREESLTEEGESRAAYDPGRTSTPDGAGTPSGYSPSPSLSSTPASNSETYGLEYETESESGEIDTKVPLGAPEHANREVANQSLALYL